MWLEEKRSIKLVVDKTSYKEYVNGYGKLNVEVKNIKGTTENFDGLSPTDFTTYLSANYGVSTVLEVYPSTDPILGHTFKSAINNSKTGMTLDNSTNGTYFKVPMSNSNNSTISVLFDASDTRKDFVIVDGYGKIRYSASLYGGYTISTINDGSQADITIKDFFGQVFT